MDCDNPGRRGWGPGYWACPQHTNVAGVYDRPPEEAGARLLRRIVVRPDGSWRAAEMEEVEAAEGGGASHAASVAGHTDVRMTVAAHDVTGGIALKVEEAAAVARLGIPVLIAEAGSEDGAEACRLGPAVLAAGRGGAGGGDGTPAQGEGAEAAEYLINVRDSTVWHGMMMTRACRLSTSAWLHRDRPEKS
ncbi:hypothetical protein TSOC_005496 [Tetrabaena socialis]|uniref:Uncharacterized protein n=1 Tax=Tetrabaena socialis TaxID=47790 RepID=A0A2J8A670_9CHLO|nr:hypothetical protein TSOC_005496 [Tetrabaena socialis]|eukprot:PNH07995.1 hypothetical protein TSOC_005496 [Tetrabaena socialis]